jgi:hypothetical protein
MPIPIISVSAKDGKNGASGPDAPVSNLLENSNGLAGESGGPGEDGISLAFVNVQLSALAPSPAPPEVLAEPALVVVDCKCEARTMDGELRRTEARVSVNAGELFRLRSQGGKGGDGGNGSRGQPGGPGSRFVFLT